jgi:hypothetical protein
MSGGPVLVIRPHVGGGGPLPTAVGFVSRSRLGVGGPIELLDHCRDGETWVSPITHAYGQPIQTANDGSVPLADVIRRGMA